MSRDELYLQHVLDAIRKIERYAAVGHDDFMVTSHWQDAVIRQLEIIGEAVKRISPESLGRRCRADERRPMDKPTEPIERFQGRFEILP